MSNIDGFDIKQRELTDEEQNRPVTWERIKSFHYSAGEDYFDTVGYNINIAIFGGWLMSQHKDLSTQILNVLNDQHRDMNDFKEIDSFGYCEDKDIDLIYLDFSRFVNCTTHLKYRKKWT